MFDSIHNFLDEYVRVGRGQNNNIPCPFCKSSLGHYSRCKLINGDIAEAHSTERSEADHIILHSLGVKW
jgi:hypothetical protein